VVTLVGPAGEASRRSDSALKVARATVYSSLVSTVAPSVSVAVTPKEAPPHALVSEFRVRVRVRVG
jgi:hypothetical protein